jgi:Fe-S-cluster-containing hydrogenase component 2
VSLCWLCYLLCPFTDNTTNATTQGKSEAANAGRVEAPDDGHKSARNM